MYPSTTMLALLLALPSTWTAPAQAADATSRPRALVYRGPAACRGCGEAVARLLEGSPPRFVVTFVGPNEETKISAEALSQAAVYAQPGGPDLRAAYRELSPHQDSLRDFVHSGGRYLGFCLGAFLAGTTPGFGLLPEGVNATPERRSPGAQVTGTEDTMIQVDWTFRASSADAGSGFATGQTATGRWLYFQDGAVVTGLAHGSSGNGSVVLGRYSRNGDVAAALTPLGRGFVAVVGPHPEATPDWYRAYSLVNPDGIKYDIGHDFVTAAMDAGPLPPGTSRAPRPSSSEESASRAQRGRLTVRNPIGVVVRSLRRVLAW